MQIALTSVAVHWCWVIAHLCEQQMSMGVIAVTQACKEPVLQSSTEQWDLHFALNLVAVLCCWVTAKLCEEHISISATAVTRCLL